MAHLASIRPPVALTGNFRRCSNSNLGYRVSARRGRWSSLVLTDPSNEAPISVKKPSRFFPVKPALAASRTLSRISQHATHGSVLTRANDRSSFRGLKSFRFCFASCAESHEITAKVEVINHQRWVWREK
jgi:hypothetical protein